MNVAMAKRCNMRIVFMSFNKYIVMPTAGGHGQRLGAEFSIREGSV
jgi:hypothetical protein